MGKPCLVTAFIGLLGTITLKDAVAVTSGIVSIAAGLCAIAYYLRKLRR
jgi:hypothetical protein